MQTVTWLAGLQVRRAVMAALATAELVSGWEQERAVAAVLALKCSDKCVARNPQLVNPRVSALCLCA
jgi:hypothetical protein